MNIEYFTCQCHSPEHTLQFFIDEQDNEIYTSVFLGQFRPWYHRIWIAIKYVFGYKCKYGHFDCFILKSEDAGKMIEMCNCIIGDKVRLGSKLFSK